MASLTLDDLSRWRPCEPARDWARAQPDQSLSSLWLTCPNATWSLWLCARAGLDTRAIAYWCAERARQSAIRVLTTAGVDCARLRDCAPIVDRQTAEAAAEAWAAAAEAWASAAWAAWAAEAAAELRAIADHVREVVPWANVEAGLRRALGGGS